MFVGTLITVGVALGSAATGGAAGLDHVFRSDGIAITYPTGWQVSNRPLGYISDPAQRFVVASYRVPGGRPNDGGDYRPPRAGVIAQLLEEQPPDPDAKKDYPVRPATFALPKLSDHVEGYSGRWGEMVFRDRGRDFYIFVGVGPSTPATRVETLLRTLDTMTVT